MKVTVIYGAPCSGKSTFVKENAQAGDIIFDYDEIANAITYDKPFRFNNEELIDLILKMRSQLITNIKTGKIQNTNVWIITTFLTQELKQELIGTDAKCIEMRATIEECRERLERDGDGRNKEETRKVIDKYYTKTTDLSSFYNSKEWKELREKVLRRDKYLCQECKAKGIYKAADEVHHVFTISTRPDLKLDSRNLISLCKLHHLQHHNHLNSELSELGKRTQRRIGFKYGLYNK